MYLGRDLSFGKFQIWNHENHTCLLEYQFEEITLFWSKMHFHDSKAKNEQNCIAPLIFTPDGQFLIARFMDEKLNCTVQIWHTETAKIYKEMGNLPKLIINSVGIRLNGTVVASGIREDKVCVWELESNQIVYTISEDCAWKQYLNHDIIENTSIRVIPGILSTDGRVLIYATAENNIVVRDLVAEQDLCSLQEHDAPIAYLALSEDREFIASYSIDRQIRIWGIPNFS